MAKILDAQTQQVIDVPDEQVTEYVASGRGSLPLGDVDVVDTTGTAGTISAEKAQEAFRNGFTFRPRAEVEAAEAREKYGDRALAAGVAAAARGGTLGLSDVALVESGAVDAETLRGLEDYNEEASIAGEVLGTAAVSLATAGSAAPAAVAERVGARAGAAVAERLAGSAVARAATAGTVEGALQGLGRAITDDAQGRDPLTAEKLVASGLEGALFGLAGGAVLGKAGDILTGGRRAAPDAAGLLDDVGELTPDIPEGAVSAMAPGRMVPAWVPRGTSAPTGPLPEGVLPGGPDGKLQSMGGPRGGGGGQPPRPPEAGATPPGEPSGGGGGRGGRGGDFATRIVEGAEAAARPVKEAIERNPGVFQRVFDVFDLKIPSADEFVLRGLDAKKGDFARLRKKGLTNLAPESLRTDPRFKQVRNADDAARLVGVKFEEEGARVREYAKAIDDAVGEADQLDVLAFVDKARRELVAKKARGTVDERATAARLEQELEALVERAEGIQAERLASATPGPEGAPVPAASRPRPRGPDGRFLTGEKRAAAEAAEAAQAGLPPPPPLRLSFADGEDFKRALDPSIKHDAATSNAVREGLEDLRAMFNREQEAVAERVSARLNRDIFEQWKTGKQEFGRMAELQKIVDSRLGDAKGANRLFSLTDNLAGMVGAIAGGGLNPVGLGLSLGAALLNKWGRENLPWVMARAMADYEGTPGAKRAAQALWKRFRNDTGGGPLQGAGGAPTGPGGGGRADLDEAMRETLRTAARSGPAETWLAHTLLSGSIEYREMAERDGFATFREDTDAEGQRRAEVLDRAEQSAQAFDKRAEAATAGLLSGKRPPFRPMSREEAERRAEQVQQAASNPDALVSRLASRLAGVGAKSPALALEMQEVAQRAQAFLASKAPARPVGPLGDIPALRQPWRPSDVELERWGAYVRAVENPASVLEDAAAGRLTPEGVEALGAVYPALLEDMRARVVAQLSAHRGAISYQQRLALGQLLGLELDESMNPAFIAAIQATYAQSPEQPRPNPSGAGPRAAKRISSEFSPSDALSQRSV